MAGALPGAEDTEDIRINVVGGVGNEDIVGGDAAPSDEFIEETIREGLGYERVVSKHDTASTARKALS